MREEKKQLVDGSTITYLVPENEKDREELSAIQRKQGREGNDSFADTLDPDQTEDFLRL
jgi:hypothetical protein